jgi:hypothetical protein
VVEETVLGEGDGAKLVVLWVRCVDALKACDAPRFR